MQNSDNKLPQIVRGAVTYKMTVPAPVEEKIRYLLRKYPSTEWSGVLFYTHTGTFEDNNLEIKCHDLYPMDLGNATYTEFNMDDNVAAYMAENIDLFDCDLGLIHSHHGMASSFSGTDISTLNDEGNKRNCFVSLIVNNAGTYSAAITRKLQTEQEVTIKNLGVSYEFFGQGKVQKIEPNEDKEPLKVVKETIIEYFPLNVTREEVENPYAWLDERFKEIEASKVKVNTTPFTKIDYAYTQEPDLFSWKRYSNTIHSSLPEIKEMEDSYGFTSEESKKYQINPTKIHEAVVSLLTCSLLIDSQKFDIDNWVSKHMKDKFDKAFINEKTDSFKAWCDYIIERVVYYMENDSPIIDDDFDTYYSEVAADIQEELEQYKGANPYVDAYFKALYNYMI